MNNLYLAWIIGLGALVFSDGLASLWAYHNTKETFWRNQSLRVLRMIIGVLIVVLASLLMRS